VRFKNSKHGRKLGHLHERRHADGMNRRCEVCENFRPDAEYDPTQKLVSMTFDARRVLLCTGHARIAANSGVSSFEQLRAFYGSGRRSFVPRRARESAPEATNRRQSPGRRAIDARRLPFDP